MGDTEKACNAPMWPQPCRQSTMGGNRIAARFFIGFQLVLINFWRPFFTSFAPLWISFAHFFTIPDLLHLFFQPIVTHFWPTFDCCPLFFENFRPDFKQFGLITDLSCSIFEHFWPVFNLYLTNIDQFSSYFQPLLTNFRLFGTVWLDQYLTPLLPPANLKHFLCICNYIVLIIFRPFFISFGPFSISYYYLWPISNNFLTNFRTVLDHFWPAFGYCDSYWQRLTNSKNDSSPHGSEVSSNLSVSAWEYLAPSIGIFNRTLLSSFRCNPVLSLIPSTLVQPRSVPPWILPSQL
jgi:hypothetical protein